MAFTKLDSGIVNSTLWLLPDDVLRVWVWFLSQANAQGEVRTAAPPLASACRIPLERMREILALLEGPDPDSRSPDEDGRRIEKIVGGWRLVNHAKYRANRDAEARKEYKRNWDRDHRARGHQRQSDSPTQSDKSDTVRHSPTQAEAEAEKDSNFSGEKLVVAASGNAPPPCEQIGKAKRCPVCEIVDLYHELLPELPRVEKITKKREGQIRQRWRKDLNSMEMWTNFFDYVRKSNFLMGKEPGTNGRPPFIANLEWITNESHFTDIAEGKYHGKVPQAGRG